MIMAAPHSFSSFKSINPNHMMLKRGKRAPYEVHKMNGFISTLSPKPIIRKLTRKERQRIRQKIKGYTKAEVRTIVKTSIITLTISASLLILFNQLWIWFNYT